MRLLCSQHTRPATENLRDHIPVVTTSRLYPGGKMISHRQQSPNSDDALFCRVGLSPLKGPLRSTQPFVTRPASPLPLKPWKTTTTCRPWPTGTVELVRPKFPAMDDLTVFDRPNYLVQISFCTSNSSARLDGISRLMTFVTTPMRKWKAISTATFPWRSGLLCRSYSSPRARGTDYGWCSPPQLPAARGNGLGTARN